MSALAGWKERDRQDIIELCQLYSGYVTQDQYTNSYLGAEDEEGNPLKLESRLSMAAFLNIHLMGADPAKTAAVYERSPDLEGPEVLRLMLLSQTDPGILNLLDGYDNYIMELDDHCRGNCPVCLSEFLGCDYGFYLLELAYERFEQQLRSYEMALVQEGAVAMRERNAETLFALDSFKASFKRFVEQYSPDSELLEYFEALAGMVRQDGLISYIFSRDWCHKVRRCVDEDTLFALFIELCRDLVAQQHG